MNTENNAPIGSNDDEGKPKWLTHKEYTDPAEKKRDFWIGVGIFFVLNVVLVLCQWGAAFGIIAAFSDFVDSGSIFTSILYIVYTLAPWVINIGLIVYFAFTRSQIALGMVAGFGIALAIVICLGVIFMVWCFAMFGAGGY